MNRAHKLYLWAIAIFALASCFIESGAYVVVGSLVFVGVVFTSWAFLVEVRDGQR